MHAVATEPVDVVGALRTALPDAFSVRIDEANGRPYAVVRRPRDEETWVDLFASIGSSNANADAMEIAAAIIQYEGWPGGFAVDRLDVRRAYRPVMDDVGRTLDVGLELDFDPEIDVSWSEPAVIIKLAGDSIVTCHDLKPDHSAQVAQAAKEIQEVIVEAVVSTAARLWPLCPMHPDHSLVAATSGDDAVWKCPATGSSVVPIGQLSAQ